MKTHFIPRLALISTIIGLSACASTPKPVVDGRWIITHIAGSETLEQHTPWLSFSPSESNHLQGKVNGHSGCNRFFANYKIQEQEIAFSPIGSTRKACPGPEMKQESALFKLLTTTLQMSQSDKVLAFRFNNQLVLELSEEEGEQ